MNLSWDDLKFLLAVADQGSTKRAAAALKVDQTTCARRISALEMTVGLSLFHRRPGGFSLTEEGAALVAPARAMAEAAEVATSIAAQLRRGHDDIIRLSVGDMFVASVVQPALVAFRERWPEARVDLAVETRYVDILKGEADVAIRPGPMPEGADLVVRRLGGNPLAVYCTQGYADRYGLPTTVEEHLARPFACMEGQALDLIRAHFPDRKPRFVASSLQPLVDAVVGGDLAALLPCFHADRMGLIRCFTIEGDTGSVWLLFHPRLKALRHARTLLDAIAEAYDRNA